jgi:DNA invertase Pin-like site-specific DNA recombinase
LGNVSKKLVFADFRNIKIALYSDASHVLTTTVVAASSDPQSRPSFQELLEKLRELQRKHNVQTQMQRNATAAAKNSTIIEE